MMYDGEKEDVTLMLLIVGIPLTVMVVGLLFFVVVGLFI